MSTTSPYPPTVTESDLSVLAARLERATESIEALTAHAAQLTPMLAVAADSADEFVSRADKRGVHVDARLQDAVVLLERLTAPETMRALGTLLDRLPQLEQLMSLADQAPGMVALGVDAVDEVMQDMQAKGIVTLISRMGTSLATAANAKPAPVGLFGALGALSNPDVKQALGLLLNFAAEFGRQLDHGSRGRANS